MIPLVVFKLRLGYIQTVALLSSLTRFTGLALKIVLISTAVSTLPSLVQTDTSLQYQTFIFHTNRVICMHVGSRLLTSDEKTIVRF